MAVNNKAKFYYRSFIDQDLDGFTLSGDFLPTTNVNNRNKSTYATTDDTGTGDGTEEQFVADMNTDRSIDTIFLKSNFAAFEIFYWSEDVTGTGGGDWVSLRSFTAQTSDWQTISFDAVATSKILIAATSTIIANEEKKIYLLEITKFIGELSLESIDLSQNYERETFKNIFGGSIQVVAYPNYGKVDIRLSWENMDVANWAIYHELKRLSMIDSFLIYLYFSDSYSLLNDESLYLVNDTEDKESSPSTPTLAAGVKAKMRLLEC